LTAHLVCAESAGDAAVLPQISAELRQRFGINHATIQLETPELAKRCGLRPDHVI
jgi:cobalt-zinc-cadmium efflux system protein